VVELLFVSLTLFRILVSLVKRRDEPGFFQPRGSLSPHHIGLHLKRPTTSNRYNPPSSSMRGTNHLFNSYNILFRSARTIAPVRGLFRVCYTSSTFSLRVRHQALLHNETSWKQAPWCRQTSLSRSLFRSYHCLSLCKAFLQPTLD
jgi:hypothetical protein